MPNKLNISVPNYLSDIRDEPFEWSEWSDVENRFVSRVIQLDQQISSLDHLVFGEVPFLKDDQMEVEYNKLHLQTYIDRLPHGIIDKQQAGIGATTLEIMCDRHSVIVVPTKFLAYNKAQKHHHCLYVGSSMKGKPTTKPSEIEAYLNNDAVKFKKILVVADSLKKVVDVLEAKEVKDAFFLMIDEVDLMQEDSNYRPSLENVMDYYFEFPPRNRCLISATIKDFSDPRLRGEIKFTLNFIKPPKRNILLTITNNINLVTKDRIEQIGVEDKILIAYNSVTNINIVIEMMSEELQEECAILCSEASIKEAKHHYRVLNEDSSLPSRINFATCCYFTGIDINDTYHLITVSGTEKSFQSLSVERIEQIAGRCRIYGGVKSETIIYDKRKQMTSMTVNCADYLIKKAHKALELQRVINDFAKRDLDLKDFFSQINNLIEQNTTQSINRGAPITLLRKNYKGEFVPAYFSIDYIADKEAYLIRLYTGTTGLYDALAIDNNVEHIEDNREVSIEQEDITASIKHKEHSILDQKMIFEIEEILRLEAEGKLTSEAIRIKVRNSKRNLRTLFERFEVLGRYVETRLLLDMLYKICTKNIKAYKKLHNSVIFWAMDDNHSFKAAVFQHFEVGRSYSIAQIDDFMLPLIKTQLHKTVTHNKAMFIFGSLFKTQRTRNGYLVISDNPLGLPIPKAKVSSSKYAANLLRL